jgi:hypothetical protein
MALGSLGSGVSDIFAGFADFTNESQGTGLLRHSLF